MQDYNEKFSNSTVCMGRFFLYIWLEVDPKDQLQKLIYYKKKIVWFEITLIKYERAFIFVCFLCRCRRCYWRLKRELNHHVYVERQTRICTTWPSFSFACRPLFIISAHKFSSFMQFFIHKNFLSCFSLLIFYFEMNSQLEPDVCRLAYTWSLNSLKIGDENVKKSNRFNTQNSCNFARASRFFVHFVAVFATTSAWKCLI